MKLSAALIVKNEAAIITRCLSSLKGFDEIVVIDTGSVDQTVEICKHAGAFVYDDFKWCDDFAAARNHAKGKCFGDWILFIDADNPLITPHDLVRLQVMEADFAEARTANIKAVYPTGQWHWVSGLAKNEKNVQWIGAVHECLTPAPMFNAEIQISVGQSPTKSSDPDRNIRILLKSDLSLPRNQFYLGKEYYERGRYAEAIAWMKAYIEGPAPWIKELAWAWLVIANCYWRDGRGRGDMARDACLQSIRQNPECAEAMRLMSEMHTSPWREKWARLATLANNEDVLFVR